ncbi:AarF/UbiB family protein [Patescibacteria group bacterium]
MKNPDRETILKSLEESEILPLEEAKEIQDEVRRGVEIQSLSHKVDRSTVIENFIKKHDYQQNERWGYLEDSEKGRPLHKLLSKIYDRLFEIYDIPQGHIVGIDSPQINAYVIKENSEVYLHSGLFNALQNWCRRHGQELTEDKIAFIIAHEMAHIEQGTEERSAEEKKRRDNQESLNHEYDADKTGLARMAAAGFNPREGIEAMRFLMSIEDLPLATTHPRSVDRARSLEEQVNDVDRFIPNVAKIPKSLSPELQGLISEATVDHPGTKLYLREGYEKLEEIAESNENFYSALEIASIAKQRDVDTLVAFEAKKNYWQEYIAHKIYYKQLVTAVKSLYDNRLYHLDTNFYTNVTTQDRFEREEFNFSEELTDPEVDTSYLESEFQSNLDRDLNSIKKAFEEILKDIRKKMNQEQRRSTPDQDEIDKLKRARQICENFLADDMSVVKRGADSVNYENYLQNTKIIDEEDDNHFKFFPKELLSTDAETIVAWCSSNGDRYFSDKNRDIIGELKRDLEKKHKGTLDFESSYERTVELPEKEDLNEYEGRKLYMATVIASLADSQFDINFEREGLDVDINSLIRPDLNIPMMPRLVDADIPTENVDRVMPELVEACTQKFRKLGIRNPDEISEFLMRMLLKMDIEGYDSNEFKRIVGNLSEEDCRIILNNFPTPSIDAEVSADSLFMAERFASNSLFSNFSQILPIFENELLLLVKQRGFEIEEIDPRVRLNQIHDYLVKSDQNMLEIYKQEIFELVKKISPNNAEELEQIMGPIFKIYPRRSSTLSVFLGELVESLENEMPIMELFKLYEGEKPRDIVSIFEELWKKNLDDSGRIELLEVFFKILPDWKEYAYSKSIILPFLEYADAYLRLKDPKTSEEKVSFFKQILISGLIFKNEDKDLVSEKFDELYNNLTPEEIMELAEFIADNRDKLKIAKDGTRYIWRNILYSALAFGMGYQDDSFEELNKNFYSGIKYGFSNSFFNKFSFKTDMPIENNLGLIKKYFGEGNNQAAIEVCLEAYGIYPAHRAYAYSPRDYKLEDNNLRSVIESSERNPDAIMEYGLINDFWKISEDVYSRPSIYLLIPDDLEDNSADYDPEAKKSFIEVIRGDIRNTVKTNLLEDYIELEGIISGYPNPSDRGVREEIAEVVGDIGVGSTYLNLSERVDRLFDFVKEDTNFCDTVMSRMEEAFFKDHEIETKGHRVVIEKLPKKKILELFSFYKKAIPLLINIEQQELWGRRAEQLYEDHLRKGQGDFKEELDKLLDLYPFASYSRDDALMRFANSELLSNSDQAKHIKGMLFDNVKRTAGKKEKSQQRTIEIFNQVVSKMSRSEKRDMVLWILGAEDQAPLTFRAFGGKHECSVEEIPELIFAATPHERSEFFMRVLYGENGLLDPKDKAENQEIFDDLLEKSFERIFPIEDPKGKMVLKTIFNTIFQEYSPFRRAKLYIAIIEALRDEDKETSVEERLKTLLELLGPVFVKVGQVTSEEEDENGEPILGESIQKEFKKLKKDAKPFHRLAAFEVLGSQGAFDEEKDDRILEVVEELGSASIKVVFKSLLANGKVEATKIRRPAIGKHLEEDLAVFGKVMEELEKIDGVNVPSGLGETIREWLNEEANFKAEAESYRRLDGVVQKYEDGRDRKILPEFKVRLPKVHSSSPDVIREEFVRGISLEDLTNLASDDSKLSEVVAKYFPELSDEARDSIEDTYLGYLDQIDQINLLAFDSLMYQVFKEGQFHADAHAGNIIISPEGELCFIDVGSSGEIQEEEMAPIKKFFYGFLFACQSAKSLSSKPKLQKLSNIFLSNTFLKTSLRQLIDAEGLDEELIEQKMSKVEDIVSNKGYSAKKKFQLILKEMTTDGLSVNPNFEKFLKALGTGSYLTRGNEKQVFDSIMRNAELKF